MRASVLTFPYSLLRRLKLLNEVEGVGDKVRWMIDGGSPFRGGEGRAGPYFREKDGSCLKKGYRSPLNSPLHLKIRRDGPPEECTPPDTRGRH